MFSVAEAVKVGKLEEEILEWMTRMIAAKDMMSEAALKVNALVVEMNLKGSVGVGEKVAVVSFLFVFENV